MRATSYGWTGEFASGTSLPSRAPSTANSRASRAEYVDADPLWLRLERAGSVVYRAYYSVDGKQWLPLKRTNTGPKREPPKALEDAMSLLKEADFGFNEASNSIEMRAPEPLLVGIVGGMVPGFALPYGISQSVTDYDYFAITGK